MKDTTVRGEATAVALGNVRPLTLPWTQDPWGCLRPPLSVDAMRLSAELAGATYHMAVDRWMQAGWRDVTIQVDGDLTTGFGTEAGDHSPMSWLASTWKMHRVRARLKQRNPIGQVVGALRQIEKSDTGKVLVMIHPTPEGRYVVALSFMGTGARFYDWFSNFRMSSESGFHKGFLQLARQFESNEPDIQFPETARELGLEKLTLSHILEEAATPGSRFTLWLTGHSQGAALIQMYAYHKIHEDGVLPRNMVGYGFASPSVAEGLAVPEPSVYPLWHVINSDDLVPRMGAQMHLGVCLIYPADEAIRTKCYAWPMDVSSAEARARVEPIVRGMVDTPACIEAAVAYLSELSRYSPDDMIAGIGVMDLSHLPIRRFMTSADARIDDLIRYIRRHAAAAYESITGVPMDQARVAALQAEIAAALEDIGVKRFSAALMELMSYPHAISPRKGAFIGAYPYITLHGVAELRPAIWRSGRPPRLEMARCGGEALPAGAQAQAPALRAVRREAPVRVARGSRRFSDIRARTDTRHHPAVPERGALKPGQKLISIK